MLAAMPTNFVIFCHYLLFVTICYSFGFGLIPDSKLRDHFAGAQRTPWECWRLNSSYLYAREAPYMRYSLRSPSLFHNITSGTMFQKFFLTLKTIF